MRDEYMSNLNEQIAQRLGWTDISTEPVHRTFRPIMTHPNRLWGYPPSVNQRRLLPDWEHDQNLAIVLPLEERQHHEYGHGLALIIGITLVTNRWEMIYLITKATAEQRCQAWLTVVDSKE